MRSPQRRYSGRTSAETRRPRPEGCGRHVTLSMRRRCSLDGRISIRRGGFAGNKRGMSPLRGSVPAWTRVTFDAQLWNRTRWRSLCDQQVGSRCPVRRDRPSRSRRRDRRSNSRLRRLMALRPSTLPPATRWCTCGAMIFWVQSPSSLVLHWSGMKWRFTCCRTAAATSR